MDLKFIKENENKLNTLKKEDKRTSLIINSFVESYKSLNSDFLLLNDNFKSHLENNNNSNDSILNKLNEEETVNKINLEDKLHKIDLLKKDLDNKLNGLTNKIELETTEKSLKINEEFKNIENNHLQFIEKANTDLAKEINSINKSITKIKKDTSNNILKIENDYTKFTKELKDNNLKAEQEINDRIKKLESKIKENNEDYQTKINEFKLQSDQKYLDIKNIYHEETKTFNQIVNKLNTKNKNAITKVKNEKENILSPLLEMEKEFKNNVTLKTNSLKKEFQISSDKISIMLEDIIINFNKKNEKIIFETNEEISLYNSKLSSLKENLQLERELASAELKNNLNKANTYSEEQTLKKEFRRFVKLQDNELKKQHNNTILSIKDITKKRYESLKSNEIKYLNKQLELNVSLNTLELELKKNIELEKLLLKHQLKELNYKKEKIVLKYQYKEDKLINDHLKELAPLDIELSIKNALSERDINILSNVTQVNINNFLFEIDNFNFKQQIRILKAKNELAINTLKYEYEQSTLNINKQLLIEKENIKLEETLIKLETKLKFIKLTNELNILKNHLKIELERVKLNNELSFFEQRKEKHRSFYQINYQYENNLLANDVYYYKNINNTKSNLNKINAHKKILNNGLTFVNYKTNYLFNQIKLFYSPLDKYCETVLSLYDLPVAPNLIKELINIFLDSLKTKNQSLLSLIKTFSEETKVFYHDLFNNLTNSNFEVNKYATELINHFKVKAHEDKINKLNLSIRDLTDKNKALSKNLEFYHDNVNRLEILMMEGTSKNDVLNKKIEISNLNKKINHLNGIVNNNIKEISILTKKIDSINKNKENLLSKQKTKISILTKNKNKVLKNYLKKITIYDHYEQILNKHVLDLENKLTLINLKLNEPIYLIDQNIKEFDRNFKRQIFTFNQNINNLKSTLIIDTEKIFNNLLSNQNKLLASFSKNLDNYTRYYNLNAKNIKQNIKNGLTNFSNILKELDLSRKNDYEQKVEVIAKNKNSIIEEYKQKLLKIENIIIDSDLKLKSELNLVDDNLRDVNKEYTEDFNKQSGRVNLSYQDNIRKTAKLIKLKRRNNKQVKDSITIKNLALEERFNQAKNNFNLQLKDKLSNLDKTSIKITNDYENNLLNIDNNITRNTNSYYDNFNKLEKYYLKLEKTKLKKETVSYKKQIKDLNKSNTFKQKALKL